MSTERQYYGGSRVRETGIRQLLATSFKELVESFFNTPYSFPMKRKEFLAHPDRDTLKDIDYVCPCTFKDPSGPRRKENAESLVLVILDLDEGDFVKDLFEAPKSVGQRLWPLSFALYTTAKHTPEAPRLRIVVDMVPFTPEGGDRVAALTREHGKAVSHVMQRLGIPPGFKGERESRVIVQPAFRPMQFKGEEFVAMLDSRTDGEALDTSDLPDEEPAETSARSYAYDGFAPEDGDVTNGLAHLPIFGLEPEDIREPLFEIDADCNRQVWIEIAASIRHQYRTEEAASEAFGLFDEWSEQGHKYQGQDHTYYQWRSLRPDAMGRLPITIRTLFHHAMQAGWSNQKVATKLSKSVQEWIAETEDGDILLEEGCRRIAALPFRNDVVEESLVIQLRDRVKKTCKKTLDKRTMLKEVARLRHAKRVEEDDGSLPGWLRPWCYIGSQHNLMFNTVNGTFSTPESFNKTFGEKLMPTDENDPQAMAGRPAIAPIDFALNVKKIRRVDGIVYDPRHNGAEPFFMIDGRSFVNEYRRASVPALDDSNSKKAGKYLRLHLSKLIREPEFQAMLLDWMAFNVQYPGHKIKWCPVIQSAQGAGKTLIVDFLEAALGKENVKRVESDSVGEKFNDWATGAQLVAFEEIWVAGKSRAELMNKLKAFMTNLRVTLNRKFQPQVTVDNIANAIAFTNKHAAIHLDDDNRRYWVLKSSLQTVSQVRALKESGHFDPLFKLVKDGGGAIRHFLLNHKINDSFDPNGHAIETKYAREMIEESKNPLQREIEEKVASGDPRFGQDIIDLSALEDEVSHMARNNHPVTHYLTELGYKNLAPGQRFQVNGHRTNIWVHREHWDEELGDAAEELRWRVSKIVGKEI